MFGKGKSKAWRQLEGVYKRFRNTEMNTLFAKDKERGVRYSEQLETMLVDYSKNRIDDEVMAALFELARERGLSEKISDMFGGKKINATENRAVLHIALRNRGNKPIYVDGRDVMPQISAILAKMKEFSEAVRLGSFTGYTGKKLTNIVNIGIGGSDLGPCMVTEALKHYQAKDIN